MSELRKTYRIENPGRKLVCITQIDGCYVRGSSERCDYLAVVLEDCHAYFIELKGSEFRKAVRQILPTMHLLHDDLDQMDLSARIVLSKAPTPRLLNFPDYLNLLKVVRKRGGTMEYASGEFTERA